MREGSPLSILFDISVMVSFLVYLGLFFEKSACSMWTFPDFLLTLHREIDRSNAGERLRTGLTANEHAPAVQRY